MSRKLTLLLCVSPLLSHHYHTHNTLTPGVCVGDPTPSNSATPVQCPTIELNSDAIYLETASNPTRLHPISYANHK